MRNRQADAAIERHGDPEELRRFIAKLNKRIEREDERNGPSQDSDDGAL